MKRLFQPLVLRSLWILEVIAAKPKAPAGTFWALMTPVAFGLLAHVEPVGLACLASFSFKAVLRR